MSCNKMKLGPAVCVFCEHCISDDYSSEFPGDFYCQLKENKRAVHPVNGLTMYISVYEYQKKQDLDFIEGTQLFSQNRDGDDEVDVQVHVTDCQYQWCEYHNKWGWCKSFEEISTEEKEKRCGKKEVADCEFDSSIRDLERSRGCQT